MARVLVEYSNRLQQAVDTALGTPSLQLKGGARSTGRSALADMSDPFPYNGYFKVINVSKTKEDGSRELKIKVTDGSDGSSELCGFAIVNGYIREVSSQEIEIGENRARTAYLYLNAVEETESDGITPKTPVFEVVDEKLLNGTQINRALIATIKIHNNSLTIIQQCYGVPYVFIWGTCQ